MCGAGGLTPSLAALAAQVAKEFQQLSEHMAALEKRDAWSLTMAYMGGVMTSVGTKVMKYEDLGASDLGYCPLWRSKAWWGKDVDFREAMRRLKAL